MKIEPLRIAVALGWSVLAASSMGCIEPQEDRATQRAELREGVQPESLKQVARPAGPPGRQLGRVVLQAGVREQRSASLDVQATAVFQQGVQPDQSYLHAGVDIWQCQPDTNYEGDQLWILGRDDGGGLNPCFGWPYLRFDLTGAIPDGATVLQAILSMYTYDAYGQVQTAASHKVLSPWTEAGLTYNSKPADWNNQIYESQVLITTYNSWWDWDLSQMVSDWVADPASNHGLSIMPIDSLAHGDVVLWRSDDYDGTSLRPRLTVDYLLPEHRSAFLSQQAPPATAFIGQELQVGLSFRNDGADIWNTANGYRLGSQSPQDNNTWGANRIDLPNPVAAGQQLDLNFQVTAPNNPGTYAFHWQMVHEGVQWFGDLSQRIDIQVERKPLAETCNSGGECASNNCVDGYCCDSACGWVCTSCALPGQEGLCSLVGAGDDPDEECPGANACGSTCDGNGACEYAPDGTNCSICASCDGAGNCNQYEPAGNDPGGQCGLCRICPGDGPNCVAATAGTDPLDECANSAPDTCGLTGDCDGQGVCAYHPAGTVCDPERCESNVHHPADTCDGLGACSDGGQDPCLPYICLDALNCRTDCSDDAHCVGVSYCDNGNCAAYLQRGEVCSQDLECLSAHCVDGVCCESACDAACEQCNLGIDPGGCLPVPDAQDPRDDCPGTGQCGGVCNGSRTCRFAPTSERCDACTTCDGAGSCSAFAAVGTDPFDDCGPCFTCSGIDNACRVADAGSDPLDDCAQSPVEQCAGDGNCDGAGNCSLWPADTVCQTATCLDGALQPADVCDGLGNCFDRGEIDCAPFTCLADDACRNACGDDTHCQNDHHCEQGDCLPDGTLGQACARDGQCATGHCADGVCCDSACDGLCQRCDLANTLGTCAPTGIGQDPDDECAGQGACGGACDGAGACALPGAESACGPCARCDGAGACAIFIEAGQDPDDACGPCRVCAGDADECVPVAPGEDPFDECSQEDVSTCGSDGTCDGQGICRQWLAGTICGDQTCVAGVLKRAPTCDGTGLCADQGSLDCAPFACDGLFCAGPENLVSVTIEDAPDGTGALVGDQHLTTDDTLEVHAVGRDLDGNSLGPVVVTWAVQGEIGTIPPGPSTSAQFDPTRPGAGRIMADFYQAHVTDGQSGELAVLPGIAVGVIALQAVPSLLPADGQALATVTGGPVQDADGNPVSLGTAVTVLSSAGELVAIDLDQLEPGIQRTTDAGGLFSFQVRAENSPGFARLRALAVAPGTAEGEGVLFFGAGGPLANAGADQTVLAGQPVSLDGSASLDPQNRMLSYAWTQLSGETVQLQSADSPGPTFIAPANTSLLTFELTVSAGGEISAPDTTQISVAGTEADLPIALLTIDPDSGPAPLLVSLDGSQSQAAACCSLVAHIWRFSDGAPSLSGPTVARSFETPGGYGVELSAIDDQGHFALARGQVSVSDGANQPPLLTVQATPDRGPAPLEVHFVASASDPDGQIASIDWDFGGGFGLSGAEQSQIFTQSGLHSVRVRATDDQGLATTWTVRIPVSTDGIYPPRIVSVPSTSGQQNQSWSYLPLAIGSTPLSWSLGKQMGSETVGAPSGMQVDTTTGALSWIPSGDQTGSIPVSLVVRNDAGSDFQDFMVQVEGGGSSDGCGCSASDTHTASLLPGLLLLGLLFRRRSGRAR